MNIFIFNNLDLESGILIINGSLKKINIHELDNTDDTLFVLPNEFLQFIEFKHDLKNNQNIHASILNNISTLHEDNENLTVLNTSNKYHFFTTNKEKLENVKNVFSKFNAKISITSDLLFFKEAFNQNCSYSNSVYLIESDEAVKLSEKSFNLLDETSEVKNVSDSDLKKIKDINTTSYQLNTFSISSIFNLQNSLKPSMAILFIIISAYIAALFNINSNYSQVQKMGTTLESIYSDIYPKENITNIYQQIEFKLDSLNNEEVTKLSKTINLLKSLSESLKILEVNYSETGFQIKCLFNNDAEESIFVNQQNRLNYNLEIVDSKTTQLGKITTISYEL